MTEQLRLDWSSAEVSDDTLTVGLSAKPPKGWLASFETTGTLLSGGRWTATVERKAVKVTPVVAGDEDAVRQFVEGAVLEANSTVVDDEQELFGGEPLDDEDDTDDETAEPSPDEELTGRFRAFAEQTEQDEEKEDGEAGATG
jgi:hypothetical protein